MNPFLLLSQAQELIPNLSRKIVVRLFEGSSKSCQLRAFDECHSRRIDVVPSLRSSLPYVKKVQ